MNEADLTFMAVSAMVALTFVGGILTLISICRDKTSRAESVSRDLDAIASPDVRKASKGFVGLVLSGFIAFCYLANSADTFDSRRNLQQFSRTLSNSSIMVLSRSLSAEVF